MRVYLQPPQPSRGLQRIADALARYAPSSVEVVDSQPDLTVIYAIGRRDAITRQVQGILGQGKKYAVIQVCLRSTMSPDSRDWLEIWAKAVTVWSYYDLQRTWAQDAGRPRKVADYWPVNFLHAPLGVDSQVFQVHPNWKDRNKDYVILSSGTNRLQESIRECHLAAKEVGRESCHLGGGPFSKLPWVHYYNDMPDSVLRATYNLCEFVSGLRRTEGFELPAAEGLLCGARPVVFDTPDYRFNYREFADYITEGTRAEVVDQLVQLFRQGARPVDAHELEEARHWFNWERVCGEFWNRCLQ